MEELDVKTIILIRKRHGRSLPHLVLHLAHLGFVDLNLWWYEGGGLDEVERGIADELAGNPQERLFEVVVTLCAELVVLEGLFPMEGDSLGLDLAIFDVDLVTTQNNRDILTDTNKIAMPLRHVLVRHTTSDVKHDDSCITLNAAFDEKQDD